MHVETYFTGIRLKVLELIQSATHSIQLAVAWFTDQELYNALLTKLEAGVSVMIIIRNDYVNNRPESLDWQFFVDNKGVLYFASPNAPLHHKFCVIDAKIVIHGSYNWTYSAAFRNLESCIVLQDEILARQFQSEISKLIEPLSDVEIIERYILTDDPEMQYQVIYSEQEERDKYLLASPSEDDAEKLLNEACSNYYNKQYEVSILFAKKVLNINPSSEEALFVLAENYYRLENYEQAQIKLLSAIDLGRAQAGFHNLLGLIYSSTKNYNEATRCFDKAIDIQPHVTTWYYNKYWSLCEAKAPSRIIEEVRYKVLEVSRVEIIRNKGNSDAVFSLMKCHFERGALRDDIPEAKKDANKALKYYESLAIDEQDLHDLDMIINLQKELR